MSLLTDDDKALLVLEHLGPAALAGDKMSLYDCFYLALDVAEKSLMEKLASAELPEPGMVTHGAIDTTEKPWFTADQLRQAYAQGAASQLSAEPEAWTWNTASQHDGFLDAHFQFSKPMDDPRIVDLCPLYTRKEANHG